MLDPPHIFPARRGYICNTAFRISRDVFIYAWVMFPTRKADEGLGENDENGEEGQEVPDGRPV